MNVLFFSAGYSFMCYEIILQIKCKNAQRETSRVMYSSVTLNYLHVVISSYNFFFKSRQS